MKKILVVDDGSTVRDMVAKIFNGADLDVEYAENGIQALKILSSNSIGLVVTEIVMAQGNGIDLIMDAKKNYPDTPIIAFSDGGGIEGRFNYLEIAKLVGADEILEKPFAADALRTIVEKLAYPVNGKTI